MVVFLGHGAAVQKRVFLMDDSAFALDLLRTALVEGGVQVSCGRDLADLARLRSEQVDLVLMDVEMPEAFGDDVALWLQTEGLAAPVYLLSGMPVEQLHRRAEECGARGFISKQLGLARVIGRVYDALGLPSTNIALSPTLLIGDFVSMAGGRLRRVRAAVDHGDPAAVANELHTLAGEAALVGLVELARAAEACRTAAVALAGETPLVVTASLHAAVEPVLAELAQARDRAKLPGPLHHAGQSARLLLLDDSDFYRSTLMTLLEDSGYEVVEVRRLAEARHRMRDGHYDLAILDLQLDDGRGSDLIPELRAHAPRTRLLLLSGEQLTRHDADLMLAKATDPGELLRQIDALVRCR